MDRKDEFMRVFVKHQMELKAFISSVVRDWQLRDDIFQEVAVVLWQKFDTYDPARPFGAWARGIARNKIMQTWEKLKKLPVLLEPEAIDAVMAAYSETEPNSSAMEEALKLCVKGLPDKSKKLIALRYEVPMKLKQIAKRFNTTLDAVNKTLSRIRAGLQKCIESKIDVLESNGSCTR